MSENAETPVPQIPKRPPLDLTPVRVPDAPAPPPEEQVDGPRDLTPISWGGTYEADADFRPMAVVSDASDPKDLSAAGSADSFVKQDDLIPTAEDATGSSQSDGLATTASAARANTPPKAPVLSKPTS